MTPEKYVEEKSLLGAEINALRKKIAEMEDEALKSKFPANVRAATPDDIVVGQIIWYRRDNEHWQVIEEVMKPDDPFKAYCAEDGCRYGLDGAFVRAT